MRRLALALIVLAGCTRGSAAPSLPTIAAEQLRTGGLDRAALARLARVPTKTLRQTLSISVRDDVSGRGFEGRGVVAVVPRSALRMILLGPGGSTAMDVWIRDGRFRVAIPALDRIVRGDRATPRSTMRGLPIDLLQRWLVDPFGGALVAARRARVGDDGQVIDDPAALLAWTRRGAALEVRERVGLRARGWWAERGRLVGHVEGEESEVVGEDALFPTRVEYVSYDPPMTVHVRTEGKVEVAALPPSTFEDPDAR